MWSCRTLTSLTHTAHIAHTVHIAYTVHIAHTHRIYNIKYHEVIHKKYQIYRARNYLDVRASQSASTITLSVYVNELLYPVPLIVCHCVILLSVVCVVWCQ